ncbi:MAG: hypothetical protein ACREQW_06480 [Candidatus Binatia bacterium]
MSATNGPEFTYLTIKKGTCYVLLVYDVALSIDLDRVEQRATQTKQRQTIKQGRRSPKHFVYNAPLRLTEEAQVLPVGPLWTIPVVDTVLYDFGAVTVVYGVDINGPFSRLAELSLNLYDNETLLADSKKRVAELLQDIQGLVQRHGISETVEDYVVFHIESLPEGVPIQRFVTEHEQEIARTLRAETQILSADEVQDVMSGRISYGLNDVTIVDWNAALVVDPEGEDIYAVLELANVELLEMRYLDQSLDRALERSYALLTRSRWKPGLRSGFADMKQIGKLQVDSAVLFEGVNNSLKLLGDQYLARVYRLVSQRFHLAEWDETIIRKLDTLESIYEKISDQVSNLRVEVLEWIIIILIAVSIALPFFFEMPH